MGRSRLPSKLSSDEQQRVDRPLILLDDEPTVQAGRITYRSDPIAARFASKMPGRVRVLVTRLYEIRPAWISRHPRALFVLEQRHTRVLPDGLVAGDQRQPHFE